MVILTDHEDCPTTSSPPASLKRKRSEDPIYDQYDVFLSFRGSDTRNGFTAHLFKALIDDAIPTFKDDDELEKGEDLKQQLEKAIKESSISIIVFSEDYASSPWCLDELVRILEQKKLRDHKVLPIFYKVDPSDVRHQKGSYGKAFNQHQQKRRFTSAEMETWKAALKEAASLGGLSFNNGGPEPEFIHKCLSTVLKYLPKYKALNIPKFLVATDDHIRTKLRGCDTRNGFTGSDPIYKRYDVFLSFRGSDTRNGFTAHLYDKLKDEAIVTFRDDDELQKGGPLKLQLDEAIKESSVSIIVFSEDYASSPWCLDELVRILEQKKLRGVHYNMLPIFYKVDPSDVRHQKGSYGKAFMLKS